jgi:hypothetical protein
MISIVLLTLSNIEKDSVEVESSRRHHYPAEIGYVGD